MTLPSMGTWRMGAALAALALAACGSNPPSGPAPAHAPPPGPTAVTPDPAYRGPDKPSAPVTLTMEARPVAGTGAVERFEVVLRATLRRAVDGLELTIGGHPWEAVAATAGGPYEARAVVEVLRGEGKDVIGTAVVLVDGRRMGAATQVRIGAPAPEAPAGTILTLPDGTRVQEVRP
jgi:hypothetical protein